MNTAPDKLKLLDKQEPAPTILVATDEGRRSILAQTLRGQGYLLFEANDEAEALHIVISQARTIHILMTDADISGYNLARSLKRYRHEMKVMFVTNHMDSSLPDTLTLATALAKVREALKLPKEIAAEIRWDRNAATCILAEPPCYPYAKATAAGALCGRGQVATSRIFRPWDERRLPKQALRAAK